MQGLPQETLVRTYPRILILNSWALSPEKGSGTARGVQGLVTGLKRLGVEAGLLTPGNGFTGLLPRVLWNLFLPLPSGYDWILGVDLDGVFLPRRERYGVLIKGVALDEAGYERIVPKLKLAFSGYLEAANLEKATLAVVPSIYSATRIKALYGFRSQKFHCVPEGIDLKFFRFPRRSHFPDPPVLLTVGHQYPRKNTRMILELFPALLKVFPEATLKIVGEGPELPRLYALAETLGIKKQIRFLGAVSCEELLRHYWESSLFLLPSLQEGFGIVFLEAMAAGLPIVALRRGAVPEVVPHGEGGFLCENLPEELLGALKTLLQDRALALRMGRFNQEYVQSFSLEASARKLLAILQEYE